MIYKKKMPQIRCLVYLRPEFLTAMVVIVLQP
jgi:hypothetical protein